MLLLPLNVSDFVIDGQQTMKLQLLNELNFKNYSDWFERERERVKHLTRSSVIGSFLKWGNSGKEFRREKLRDQISFFYFNWTSSLSLTCAWKQTRIIAMFTQITTHMIVLKLQHTIAKMKCIICLFLYFIFLFPVQVVK